MASFDVAFSCDSSFDVSFAGASSFEVDFGVVTASSQLPEYEGPYEADALFSRQVFPTAHKSMRSDFTVNEIVMQEAPNQAGGLTLSI